MAISTIDESQRKAARFARLLYLFPGVSAYFAEFYVCSNLIVYGDAAKTASNIVASEYPASPRSCGGPSWRL